MDSVGKKMQINLLELVELFIRVSWPSVVHLLITVPVCPLFVKLGWCKWSVTLCSHLQEPFAFIKSELAQASRVNRFIMDLLGSRMTQIPDFIFDKLLVRVDEVERCKVQTVYVEVEICYQVITLCSQSVFAPYCSMVINRYEGFPEFSVKFPGKWL